MKIIDRLGSYQKTVFDRSSNFFKHSVEHLKNKLQQIKNQKEFAEEAEHAEFAPGIQAVFMEKPATFFWAFPVILSIFIGMLIVWMVLSETDVVSPTPGKIMASKGIHHVQPIDSGIIANVPLSEGDTVKKGELLIEFLSGDLELETKSFQKEIFITQAEIYRLSSFLKTIHSQVSPVSKPVNAPVEVLRHEQLLLENKISAFQSEMSTLEIKIKSAEQEKLYIGGEIDKLKRLIPLSRQRVDRLKPLIKSGMVTKGEYETLLEDLITKEEDLKIKGLQAKKLQTEIDYNREEKRLLKHNNIKQTSQLLLEAHQRLESLQISLNKAEEQLKKKRILSPINGIVHNLRLHTVGSVVQPGELIMQIIPSETPLEVEAKVLNRDIGFVHTGQNVKFKIDSFPFTKYGYIPGVVKKVERASVVDEELGDIYPTIVELLDTKIKIDGNYVRLKPGMSGVVDIKTGDRKLIEFIISPFLRYRDEAMRER